MPAGRGRRLDVGLGAIGGRAGGQGVGVEAFFLGREAWPPGCDRASCKPFPFKGQPSLRVEQATVRGLSGEVLDEKVAQASVGLDVRSRRPPPGNSPGWHNWTIKDGLPHVQPPVEVLEGMITLRLHLDACQIDNGPLRVLPGSHLSGRLSQPEILARLATLKPVDCVCQAGQVLAMKPLLVHSSGSATRPNRRRVVHLEFCPGRLLPPEFKRIDPV